jgi:hypothetical protein
MIVKASAIIPLSTVESRDDHKVLVWTRSIKTLPTEIGVGRMS